MGRNRLTGPAAGRTAAVLTALAVLTGSAAQAAAAVTDTPAAGPTGSIHLVATAGSPIYDDNNELVYPVQVANLGPDTATGVTVKETGWYCEPPGSDTCLRLPSRKHPTLHFDFKHHMSPVKPGTAHHFLVRVPLPDMNPATIRTTIEVIESDQTDTASVPGTCQDGANPQDDCAVPVYVLN